MQDCHKKLKIPTQVSTTHTTQTANNALEDHAIEAQTDISEVAAKAMSAVAQAILTNMLTGSHSSRGTRAAEPVSFDGSRDKVEQFVQSICISITMQLDMFTDKRIKILYALSFMCGGIVQIWAENETNAVLSTPPCSPPL